MTILRLAHISLEGLYVTGFPNVNVANKCSVLDGRVRALRDNLSKQWSELLYNGMYFSPEREFLQRKFKTQSTAMNLANRGKQRVWTSPSAASTARSASACTRATPTASAGPPPRSSTPRRTPPWTRSPPSTPPRL